jgi:hypothetical protein
MEANRIATLAKGAESSQWEEWWTWSSVMWARTPSTWKGAFLLTATVGSLVTSGSLVPSLGTKYLYFLIMFSGHRRYADLAQWISMDHMGKWRKKWRHSHIHRPGNSHHGKRWKIGPTRWLEAAGPPCETFSFARWLFLEDGQGPHWEQQKNRGCVTIWVSEK